MEINSRFTCPLPDSINLIDFVFEHCDKYADREAVVSLDASFRMCTLLFMNAKYDYYWQICSLIAWLNSVERVVDIIFF